MFDTSICHRFSSKGKILFLPKKLFYIIMQKGKFTWFFTQEFMTILNMSNRYKHDVFACMDIWKIIENNAPKFSFPYNTTRFFYITTKWAIIFAESFFSSESFLEICICSKCHIYWISRLSPSTLSVKRPAMFFLYFLPFRAWKVKMKNWSKKTVA